MFNWIRFSCWFETSSDKLQNINQSVTCEQWRSQKYFPGEQMVSVWGREPPVGSRGEAPVGGLGAKPPRSWRLYYKMNVQFLALAYTHIHLAAYSCKVLFTLTALKSPNCSVSRVTAASVAAAGLTTSRCYAHRARHLTVCAEATEDSTCCDFCCSANLQFALSASLTYRTPPPRLKIYHRFCTNYIVVLGSPGGAVAPFAPYWLRHCVWAVLRRSL